MYLTKPMGGGKNNILIDFGNKLELLVCMCLGKGPVSYLVSSFYSSASRCPKLGEQAIIIIIPSFVVGFKGIISKI
jgi:hypothetical protein